jgi:hypothetical protein
VVTRPLGGPVRNGGLRVRPRRGSPPVQPVRRVAGRRLPLVPASHVHRHRRRRRLIDPRHTRRWTSHQGEVSGTPAHCSSAWTSRTCPCRRSGDASARTKPAHWTLTTRPPRRGVFRYRSRGQPSTTSNSSGGIKGATAAAGGVGAPDGRPHRVRTASRPAQRRCEISLTAVKTSRKAASKYAWPKQQVQVTVLDEVTVGDPVASTAATLLGVGTRPRCWRSRLETRLKCLPQPERAHSMFERFFPMPSRRPCPPAWRETAPGDQQRRNRTIV